MGRHPRLNAEQRLAVVRQSEKQPEWKQKQLGEWAAEVYKLDFVPSQPTISIVLRQGGRPVKVRGPNKKPKKAREKRPKLVKCPQVEREMVKWLDAQIEKDAAVSAAAVQTKAQELVLKLSVKVDGFVVSDPWVDNFMRHHVLHCPFGLSDSDVTDAEEPAHKAIGQISKKAETDAKSAAGKTSRRVAKVLVVKEGSRTPVAGNLDPPAGKRKRDGMDSGEQEESAKARR